ncbi:AAA family ATPase [Candidatus Roizmanbacteria bacterium]|nr:AAA family ATPase [Candidatus Roizmanbacteria bacterium]
MRFIKITVSGKICTGKTTLFWRLQKKLNWPTFSTGQFFRDYARQHNLSLEKADEQKENITKEVDCRVRDLLKQDKYIIVEGWMTGIMADKFPRILKILLVCEDKERIRRFSQREKIPFIQAEKRLRERENNWLKKLKVIYKRNDIFDPKTYNLIINTTKLSPNEVFKKVIKKLK